MKFLVVDDHALIRDAVAAVLREIDSGATVVPAADGAAAEAALADHGEVDLALLDIQLPGTSGLELLQRWRERLPEMAVVMLSGVRDPDLVRRALALGASGYIPKTDTREVMTSALRLVMNGGVYVPPEALQAAAADAPGPPSASARPAPPPIPGLTGRQLDVLDLMMQGYSNKRICRALDLAEPTVKNHVSAILRALGVASRAEAIVLVSRRGWMPARSPVPD